MELKTENYESPKLLCEINFKSARVVCSSVNGTESYEYDEETRLY